MLKRVWNIRWGPECLWIIEDWWIVIGILPLALRIKYFLQGNGYLQSSEKGFKIFSERIHQCPKNRNHRLVFCFLFQFSLLSHGWIWFAGIKLHNWCLRHDWWRFHAVIMVTNILTKLRRMHSSSQCRTCAVMTLHRLYVRELKANSKTGILHPGRCSPKLVLH